jgi:hypothetical protein
MHTHVRSGKNVVRSYIAGVAADLACRGRLAQHALVLAGRGVQAQAVQLL